MSSVLHEPRPVDKRKRVVPVDDDRFWEILCTCNDRFCVQWVKVFAEEPDLAQQYLDALHGVSGRLKVSTERARQRTHWIGLGAIVAMFAALVFAVVASAL